MITLIVCFLHLYDIKKKHVNILTTPQIRVRIKIILAAVITGNRVQGSFYKMKTYKGNKQIRPEYRKFLRY